MSGIRIETLTGERLKARLPDVARLRIEVFRDFPYLYDGNLDYEARYIASFAASPNALVVAAFDGDAVVGASTAAPMATQMDEVTAPFRARGEDLARYFYFGESVLSRTYRGGGIGVRFFEEREAHARVCGASVATFCAVVRERDHPARPADYVPLDAFWRRRGFEIAPGLLCSLSWKEIGADGESPKTMQFLDQEAFMIVRIAAAQYPIDAIASWESYADKIAHWVRDAAQNGARLLLFPEYGAMELARSFAPEVWSDLQQSIDFVGAMRGKIDALHASLAEQHDVVIVAASLPERDEDGVAHNVARVVSPKGRIGEQRKLMMTRFEREQWHVAGGDEINVFKTRAGTFGVAICYDSEFPLIARAMSEAGARMILVPSCTDSAHGYHRVRVAAQARALENQCYVVQSPTVGEALWSPAVDVNVGAAGVFGPPDLGFPADGVVAMGEMNQTAWLYADLDLAAVARVRREGKVLNDRHWAEQPGALPLKANVVEL